MSYYGFKDTYEPGEKETRMDPGSDPIIIIDKVMVDVDDINGNLVKVDISKFIDVLSDIDYDWAGEQILESLKK